MTRPIAPTLIGLAVALSLLVAAPPSCTAPSHAGSRVTNLFGGPEATATIASPDTVEAFRLESQREHGVFPLLADYTAAGDPIPVDDALRARLERVLLDDGTYEWEMAKGCEPDFGVRIRFARGNDEVDVLFCFSCQMLRPHHAGAFLAMEDFDHGNAELVSIVKEIFPADEAVQALR